jgi:NDP-sugar pyrophosphorylase family protein
MRDLIQRNEAVASYPFDGYWLDIGRPDDYERANLEIHNLPHLLP